MAPEADGRGNKKKFFMKNYFTKSCFPDLEDQIKAHTKTPDLFGQADAVVRGTTGA